MTPHDRVLELLALANDDLYVARVLLPDPKAADSMVGFHLQQTVEKLLKTLLAERNVECPRTHSLLRLIHLAGEHSYAPPEFVQELVALNHGVAVKRYKLRPPATALDRVRVLALVERFREWVEEEVG